VRRLALVRSTRFDPVIGSDRKIDHLLRIPVEVTENQAEASVGVFEPAFESARDAGTRFVRGFKG